VDRADAYLRAKFYLDPSNRLATIHQRHRQDRTDRQTGRQGRQQSDSIGRTVLQTVAQKGCHFFEMRCGYVTKQPNVSTRGLAIAEGLRAVAFLWRILFTIGWLVLSLVSLLTYTNLEEPSDV